MDISSAIYSIFSIPLVTYTKHKNYPHNEFIIGKMTDVGYHMINNIECDQFAWLGITQARCGASVQASYGAFIRSLLNIYAYDRPFTMGRPMIDGQYLWVYYSIGYFTKDQRSNEELYKEKVRRCKKFSLYESDFQADLVKMDQIHRLVTSYYGHYDKLALADYNSIRNYL